MEENKEIFTYTYSARQQEEVRRILQKYTSPQEDKMELLRRLDKSAQQPGTIAGIALGVCGTLMLGLGMCCTMVWTGDFRPGRGRRLHRHRRAGAGLSDVSALTKRRARTACAADRGAQPGAVGAIACMRARNRTITAVSAPPGRTNQFFRPENAQSCLQQFLKYFVDVCYNKGAI